MRISDWSSDVCSSDLTQAGDLEVGLSRLAQESSAAQEASAIATQRITTQVTQIELATERTGNQIETLTARLNENVDSALVRTAEAVEATRNSVNLQSEAMLGAVESARLTLAERSEARRVGKECVSTCRYSGAARH